MSIIHVNQIKNRIQAIYANKIDLTDVDKGNISPSAKEQFFLTRALAAYAIHVLGHVDADITAAAITDGGDDNGIDAIHYDEREKRLYIVQSKWINDGRGEPENGDVKKFVAGIRDLFDQSFERFNAKIAAKKASVDQALLDPATRYYIILAYTGSDGLAEPSTRDLNDLALEMNDTSEVVYLNILRQRELHSSLITAIAGDPITLNIALSHWGKIESPKLAYYGQVSGRQIAEWWNNFGALLFAKNLRGVLGDTEVNEEMKTTLEKTPELFWYYNNGITLISKSIERAMAGGGDRSQTSFQCVGVSVVNGAQTVSTIGKFAKPLDPNFEKLSVQLRVIALDEDVDFGENITKTNNRQNRIENRDFVSLDPEQARLQNELAIDGIQYHLLRSEGATRSETATDLTESTIALACAASDSGMAVQLKREIGKLWENLEKPPYRALFNPSVTGLRLWRCVQIQRLIDRSIEKSVAALSDVRGRSYSVFVHGNRMIASDIFSQIPKQKLIDPAASIDDVSAPAYIDSLVLAAHDRLFTRLEAKYPGSVIPTLFKNASKCKVLSEQGPAIEIQDPVDNQESEANPSHEADQE
jgi:hypothetical protein